MVSCFWVLFVCVGTETVQQFALKLRSRFALVQGKGIDSERHASSRTVAFTSPVCILFNNESHRYSSNKIVVITKQSTWLQMGPKRSTLHLF